MPYPQLSGSTGLTSEPSTGRAVLFSVLALAAIMGVAAWRFLPHPAPPVPTPAPAQMVAPPLEATPPPAKPAPEPPPNPGPTEDQRLHLDHAEQALVAAAEQLIAARQVLAALSPNLSRSYLKYERRQADSAWTSCDAAARAIEQALDDIKVITSKGKD